MRIIITGGPKTGKTSLARSLARRAPAGATGPVMHTDDAITAGDIEAQAAEVLRWLQRPGPWIMEGVTAARALRAWLRTHQGKPPVDRVIVLSRPLATRTPEQERMAKGTDTIMQEVVMRLRAAGVRVL
jgi:broad-specificity NMP kinase